jgi:hypothetical protein
VIIVELIAVCAGLVTVDIESSVIWLIHDTANEFFRHNKVDWIASAPEQIALTCLTSLYLCRLPIWFLEFTLVRAPLLTHDLFLLYEITYWGLHAYDSQDKVHDHIV